MDQFPLTLVDLFKFLSTPVFIGFLVSFLLERVPWFQNLTSDAKAFVSLIVAVLLPIISYALLNYVPASFVEALQPWYAAGATGAIGFIGSQVWHLIFKPKTYYEDDDGDQPLAMTDARGTAVDFTLDDDVQARLDRKGLGSKAGSTSNGAWRPGIGFDR